MQIQVSNPDESWYGQKKSRWAMDAISKLVTAAFASHSAVKPEFGTSSACLSCGSSLETGIVIGKRFAKTRKLDPRIRIRLKDSGDVYVWVCVALHR